jgi:hypothetical protein
LVSFLLFPCSKILPSVFSNNISSNRDSTKVFGKKKKKGRERAHVLQNPI